MKSIIIIVLAFFAINLSAQTEAIQTETVQSDVVETVIKTAKFKTSAECSMCKRTIEKALRKVDGVTYSKLNVPTKILKVKFDSEKVCEDDIRAAVAAVGYDADDVEADAKAYKKLPKCCKKGGMANH